jgi:hypothetical protein
VTRGWKARGRPEKESLVSKEGEEPRDDHNLVDWDRMRKGGQQ